MSRIDIREFEPDTMYRSIVIKEHRHINLIMTYKTKLNKFFIYRQDFKIMSDGYALTELQVIDIAIQRTGFGNKKFFKCPYCGERRQNLYFDKDELKFTCRSCININIYKFRCNLYDNGNGECLIYYKVARILKMLKAPMQGVVMPRIFMLQLLSNLPEKPKYMREEKYALNLKRLYFLYWMWDECICGRQNYTATDINDMLEENNANFVYEHILFPIYHKETFEVLKNKIF